MLQQFLLHIDKNNLFHPGDKILLAVSGGLDSMVMLHLFKTAGFNIAVAHCNFQLRPAEAAREEKLVLEVCANVGIPVFTERFDTKAYAEQNGLSTQVAARNLRYSFFERVLADEGYNYVATAHHANDSFETVLINLIRGSGIDGLAGIPVKSDRVIRPLLFASRDDIHGYALQNEVAWCEDSSNQENQYTRNLIRNKVIPILKTINPNLDTSLKNTLVRINAAKSFSENVIDTVYQRAVKHVGNETHIDKQHFDAEPFPEVILWELVKDFGFGFDQCSQIMNDHQSGKMFFSSTHQILVNRGMLILSEVDTSEIQPLEITAQLARVGNGKSSLTMTIKQVAQFQKNYNPHVAQFDLNKLSFPLTWRKWKSGDAFIPFGMSNKKKVSDFLIDLKLSRNEKEQVTVLESRGEIVWVVGYRISNFVRISEETKEIVVVEFAPTRDLVDDKGQD